MGRRAASADECINSLRPARIPRSGGARTQQARGPDDLAPLENANELCERPFGIAIRQSLDKQ